MLILYVWTATFAFGVALMAFVPLSYGLLAGTLAVAVAAALTFGPLRRPRSSQQARAMTGVPGSRAPL